MITYISELPHRTNINNLQKFISGQGDYAKIYRIIMQNYTRRLGMSKMRRGSSKKGERFIEAVNPSCQNLM